MFHHVEKLVDVSGIDKRFVALNVDDNRARFLYVRVLDIRVFDVGFVLCFIGVFRKQARDDFGDAVGASCAFDTRQNHARVLWRKAFLHRARNAVVVGGDQNRTRGACLQSAFDNVGDYRFVAQHR